KFTPVRNRLAIQLQNLVAVAESGTVCGGGAVGDVQGGNASRVSEEFSYAKRVDCGRLFSRRIDGALLPVVRYGDRNPRGCIHPIQRFETLFPGRVLQVV